MPEVSARTAGTLVAAAGGALGAPHVTHTLEYAGDAAAVAVHVVVPIALAAVLVAAGYLLAAERLVPEGEVARALGWLLVGVAVLEFMTAWMLAGVVVDGGIVPEPSEALLNAATVGGLVGLLVGVYDGRVRHQQRYVDQLNRINNTLRIASQELVHADSRKEIERAVCTRLTESDPYDSAWVGRHDRERSRVVPSTWAGIDDEYVESIVITVDDSPTGNGPGGQAIKTGELQAIQNVLDDPSAEPWRDLFESEGVESLAVVPFVHGDTVETELGSVSRDQIHGLAPEYDRTRIDVLVRPDDLRATPEPRLDADADPNGTVVGRRYLGPTILYEVELDDGTSLQCMHNHDAGIPMDARVRVALAAAHDLSWFPADQRPGDGDDGDGTARGLNGNVVGHPDALDDA